MSKSAAATAPTPAPSSSPAPAKSKSRRAMIIAVAGLVFAAGGGGAWFFLGNKVEGAHAEVKHEAAKKDPMFLPLEIFTVNLADTESDRYAQVGVTLGVADSAVDTAVKAHLPIIRSNILMLLAGKRAADMSTAADKAKLAEEIAEAVRAPLPTAAAKKGVEGVYFSTLIIQ